MYAALCPDTESSPGVGARNRFGADAMRPGMAHCGAMNTTSRCDRIIALIDACLAEQNDTTRVIAAGLPQSSPRNPSRHVHAARSAP